MPVYLGISCVKGGRGERRGGGGGRVEKEVESSTTLAGVTLEELEQTLLGKKSGKGREGEGRGGGANVNSGSFKDGHLTQIWTNEKNSTLPNLIPGKLWMLPRKHAEIMK